MDISNPDLHPPAHVAISQAQIQRKAPYAHYEFQQKAMPDSWDPVAAEVDGVPVSCFYARAIGKPKAKILAISGLQSSPLARADDFEKLRRQGVSILSIELRPEKDPRTYIDINRRIVEELAFNPRSVLHSIGDRKIPYTLMPHSTAAMFALDIFTRDENTFGQALDTYDGILSLNPFFDTGRSSERHFPTLKKVYETYAKRHQNDPVLGSWLERLVVREKSNDFFYGAPTHGMVLELCKESRALQDSLFKGERPVTAHSAFRAFPQGFVLGKKDNTVCNMTATDVAGALGINTREAVIGHSNALNDEKSLEIILGFINAPHLAKPAAPKVARSERAHDYANDLMYHIL